VLAFAGSWAVSAAGARFAASDVRAESSANRPATTEPQGGEAEGAVETASYDLEARLDASTHVVTGKGTLHWTNRSSTPVRELWFHLYLNAFKNDHTLFLRSPFGAGRSGDHAEKWGYIDISRLAVRQLGGKDLWPGADRTSPGDPDDQTDIRVPLPDAVDPGKSIDIELEWTSQLPEIVERTGYSGSFHMVGQWFPKIARLEPDGRWAHFAFHPQAEFYADFGRYHVVLDVPKEMILGATGKRVADETRGDRQVATFEAQSVHDFAWTAWDRFRERTERIDDVDVHLLYPPGNDTNADRTLSALRAALPRFSQLYGRYPHPTLTVVHPPDYARNAGGMEYPTLITTGGPWWIGKSGFRVVEMITIHELGHQWFQGTIATDEPEWPFLDEGVNTWAEIDTMQSLYGAGSLVSSGSLVLSEVAMFRMGASRSAQDDPIAQPASRFSSFDSLGTLVYSRTGTLLETLARVWGRDKLRAAIGRYARQQRFQHPTPKVFESAIRDELGPEAAEALHVGLFDKGWVDYAVDDLACVTTEEPAGVFERDTGRVTLDRPSKEGGPTYSCRALVRRRGTLRFPVHVDLHLDDGSVERRSWSGEESWIGVEHTGPHRVVAAIVDPDLAIPLDNNLGNNTRRNRPLLADRTLERTTYVLSLLLGGLGP